MEIKDQYRNIKFLYNILMEHKFDEKNDEGFSEIIVENDSYISGLIVKKTPVLLNVFDILTQNVIRKEEIIISKINFSIDVENNLVEIFTSSLREAKKAYIVITHTLKEDLKIYPYDKSISSTIIQFKNLFDDLDFLKLNIKNFKIEDYAEGYFEIKNIENDFAWTLIEKYKGNITRCTVNVDYENVTHTLQIAENGKIKVTSKNKNKTRAFFDVLKTQILKY